MSYIKYGSDERQIIKKYQIPASNSHKVFIFIHGGAWRDPANTCNDSDELVKHLNKYQNSKSTSNFYSIDYRLSINNHVFPSFLIDVLLALKAIEKDLLTTNVNLKGYEFILSGHSVGATLVLQTLAAPNILKSWWEINKDPIVELKKILIDEEITNFASLRLKLLSNFGTKIMEPKAVVLLDGIYNLETLIKEYPDYEGFVNEAHNNKKEYESSTIYKHLPDSTDYLLIQSTNDELLSKRQTIEFVKYSNDWKFKNELIIEDFGKHNDVYINEKVANLIFEKVLSI